MLITLFAEESKEAGGRVLRALVLLVVALLFAGLGYVFLIIGIAFVLNALLGWPWYAITIGLAVLHLGGAAGLGYQMIQFFKTPAYPSFRVEVQKDLTILKGKIVNHGPDLQTPTP